MSKKRKGVFIALAVILCLALLREVGVLDINLYTSVLSSSHSSSMAQRSLGESEERFGYRLIIKRGGKLIAKQTHNYNNLPQIEIEAVLDKPVYSGNTFTPFVKNFKMTYVCNFKTTKSPSGHEVSGKVDGSVTAKIYGFCSRRKGKTLALKEAEKQIKTFFQKQLNS